MKKKIIILSNHFVTVFKFRRELIMSLVDRGYEVIISLPDSKEIEKLQELGAKVVVTNMDRKGLNPLKDFKLFINYIKLLKKEKPDTVISYTIKPNAYGGLACKFHKCEFIANVTGLGSAYYKGGFIKKTVGTLYKLSFKNANAVFFENESNAQVLIDNKTIKKEQAVVMNGAGVNLEQFKFELMPSDEIVKFLFIGRIMKEKGVDELFEAIKRIKNEYDNIEFGFIGWFEDDYSEIIKDLEKNNLIKYYGYQNDVIPFIKDCHCVILPSYHEGMANVLLEGAAIGRAIITSDIPGCKESVVDGKSGYICEVKNVNKLCERIKDFINMNFENKQQMGKLGRKHMECNFDKYEVVNKTILVLEAFK